MNKEFTRETRYVVLKNADIMQCLTIKELIELRHIQARVTEHRMAIGKPRLDCVVVEADWPEYEPTWKAIEARMMGSLKESAVQTAAQVMDIELIRERDDLRAENDELRKALAQKVTSETMLRDLSVGNGSINASFEGGAVHLLVDSLATQFVESGAHNYIEMQFHSEATGPLLLTLQRVNGMTPHELLAKVEKERDILCDRLVLESQKNSALHEAVNRACEERDDLRIALRHEADCVEAAKSEIEALGAKIAEMEQQEPIAYRGKVPDDWPTEEMTTAFARVFNVRDQYGTFPQAFHAALAVAPEAKSEFKKRFASPPRSMIEDSVKEAGISDAPFDFQIVSLEDLERFAAIISKHERDACYEIAQSELRNMSALMSNPPKSAAAWEIARRIQARNNL